MENFVFKKEWREALKDYPADVRAEVYEAIMAYAFEGVVVEMGALAKMAFNFIKLSLDAMQDSYKKKCDRNRDSANRRWGKSEDANGCERIQTDANGCEAMRGDAINTIQYNTIQDNISLSFDEREKIFEIFYFERNLATAKEECEKFINHYEANGWCRGNSDKPVKNKVALAKSWKVEREEKRYPTKVMEWLYGVYLKAKEEGKSAEAIISGIERIMEENGKAVIICNKMAYQLCEMFSPTIKRDFEHSYKVRREA